VLEPARRGGPPKPEVYFRIVHVVLDVADGWALRIRKVMVSISRIQTLQLADP
jgi:hypothetical protein